MRIISKFHDFYDVGQRSMMDKECLYLRDTIELVGKEQVPQCCYAFEDEIPRHGKQKKGSIRFEIIGLCGRIIPVLVVSCSKDAWDEYWTKHVYSIDQLHENAYEMKDICERWLNREGFTRFGWRIPAEGMNFVSLEELFLRFRVPIFHVKFSYHGPKLILNPSLKDLEFFRFIDPITTFQEIFRFMSNDLADIQEVKTNISDKDMAASKGFGHKYAFKSEPGTKTRKGKRKGKSTTTP